MLQQTLFCDFCNNEITPRTHDYARITTGLGKNLGSGSRHYDLCMNCLAKILGLRDQLYNQER